jgi:outer membrane lipoprotein SlyB
MTMTKAGFAGLSLALVMAAGAAFAQAPQTVRIRGQIAKIDGNVLTIKTRSGSDATVTLTEDARVAALVPATLDDIKADTYIGVTAMPEPDGSQKALAIHIFPEAMRGSGEGHRPWDLQPNSTMTNAAVASKVASVDGQTLVVKYKDGEKKVIVAPSTPIVAYANGDRSEVKAGAQVIVMGAVKKPDGSLETNRINVGRGVTPPM